MLIRYSVFLLLTMSITAAASAQTANIVHGPYGPVVVPGQAMQQQFNQPQQQFNQPQQQFRQPQQQFNQPQQQFMQQQQPQQFAQPQQQFMQPQQQFAQPQQQFMRPQQQGIFQQQNQQQNRPFQQARPLAGQILNFIANEIPQQGNEKSKKLLGAIGNGLSGNNMNQPQQQQNGAFQRVPGGWASGQTFAGNNAQTNGINTQSSHYQDSAFAAGREAGKANSKFQQTQVLDANGNPIGYNNTQTWNNAITGQQHYKSNTYTPNNSGGVQKSAGFGLTGGR